MKALADLENRKNQLRGQMAETEEQQRVLSALVGKGRPVTMSDMTEGFHWVVNKFGDLTIVRAFGPTSPFVQQQGTEHPFILEGALYLGPVKPLDLNA